MWTIAAAAGGKLVKGLWAFLTTPLGMLVLVIALIYGAYWWGGERGEDRANAVWEKKWETHLAEDKEARRKAKEAHDAALALQKERSEAVIAGINLELAAERRKKQKVHTIVKEVDRYVTAEADARTVIPAGFVWMHNAAIDPELAGSPPRDVDAPSGVALSAVAGTVADNYAECQYRGALIESWQKWYHENKTIWEQVQKDTKMNKFGGRNSGTLKSGGEGDPSRVETSAAVPDPAAAELVHDDARGAGGSHPSVGEPQGHGPPVASVP